MKEELLALIEQIDSIEAHFHCTQSSPGLAIPPIAEIYDIPEFQRWIPKVQLELQEIITRTGDQFVADVLECAKKKYDGWHDKQNFNELKGKLLAMKDNLDTYYGANNENLAVPERKTPKIFISHSSKDKEYVRKLVDLLESMGLDNTQVFCSSLPGYDIPIGKNIFDYLRNQFLTYELHVFFIHSKYYYQSPVSLNEMGAAWALKTEYSSLLLPGFGFDEMKGVVNSQAIAIKLDNDKTEVKDKLNQLHSKLIDEFALTRKADIVWEQKRDRFIEDVLTIPPATFEDDAPSVESDIEIVGKRSPCSQVRSC